MAGLKKNKKYWTGFIFAALTLFVSFPLNAQDTRYGIPPTEYFNRSEYNGGSQNWSITQSNHDILYFANNEGVLEYDGVSWNIYKDMGPYIVRSVRSVNNKIYVGTYSEMGYFSYENNHGLRYTSLVKDENLRSNTDYWNIHQWNDKIVFHSEQAIYIMKDDSLECIIPAVSRFSRSFLVNGMLLVHDDAEGLMEIRGEHVYPVSGGGILKDKLVTSLLPVSEDEIIIGTMEDGLYKWDMQSVRRWDVPASEVLQMANIYCGTNYRNKYLVFGTIQSGVVITDRYGKIIFQIGKDKGLNNNTVLSLFTDRDANLWAGLDNGIVKINLQASITFLQGFYDLGTGYSISRINNVWYFGTNQALYSISDEQFSSPFNDRYNFVRVPGTNGQVWNLYNTGKCILCGHNSGVFRVDENGAELITPPSINGVWIFKNIPGEDDLLIAGTYNGLILLEKKNNRWQYKSKIEGFNESSRYIEWDQNEDLWMSHGYEGIYRLKFDNNYTEVVAIDTFDLEENHELKPAPVISRVDGKLLINSSNGIFYVSEYGKIERYPDLDEHFTRGFPDRVIQDGFRNIWYFTGRHTGVLRYLEDGTYKNIVYPFIPLENKLVPSFESVFVYDNDNILF
ncbi:MAG TPA: regulator, partial [Bacteroidales bacterium]|nr:regulator [Bacteroidales bacterium]